MLEPLQDSNTNSWITSFQDLILINPSDWSPQQLTTPSMDSDNGTPRAGPRKRGRPPKGARPPKQIDNSPREEKATARTALLVTPKLDPEDLTTPRRELRKRKATGLVDYGSSKGKENEVPDVETPRGNSGRKRRKTLTTTTPKVVTEDFTTKETNNKRQCFTPIVVKKEPYTAERSFKRPDIPYDPRRVLRVNIGPKIILQYPAKVSVQAQHVSEPPRPEYMDDDPAKLGSVAPCICRVTSAVVPCHDNKATEEQLKELTSITALIKADVKPMPVLSMTSQQPLDTVATHSSLFAFNTDYYNSFLVRNRCVANVLVDDLPLNFFECSFCSQVFTERIDAQVHMDQLCSRALGQRTTI